MEKPKALQYHVVCQQIPTCPLQLKHKRGPFHTANGNENGNKRNKEKRDNTTNTLSRALHMGKSCASCIWPRARPRPNLVCRQLSDFAKALTDELSQLRFMLRPIFVGDAGKAANDILSKGGLVSNSQNIRMSLVKAPQEDFARQTLFATKRRPSARLSLIIRTSDGLVPRTARVFV